MMNDENLIELVRNYKVLYDLSHSKYMDVNYKQEIWKKIAKEIKSDVSSCKTRWANIRDNYRKSTKKFKTTSGQGAKSVKLYKYSDQLSFLNKYFQERETKGNIESPTNTLAINEENSVEPHRSDAEDELSNADDITLLDMDVQSQALPSQCDTDVPSVSKEPAPITRKRSIKGQTPTKTASATLMEYLIKQRKESSTITNTPPHPVDAFLAGVAPSLKTLTPYYLHMAKSEIFASVQKYELKMLTQQHQYGRPYHTTSPQDISHGRSSTSTTSTPLLSPASQILEDTTMFDNQGYPPLQNFSQHFGAN